MSTREVFNLNNWINNNTPDAVQVDYKIDPIGYTTYNDAKMLERDGWELPGIQTLIALKNTVKLYGDFWSYNVYDQNPDLRIGYNHTFHYPILRIDSDKCRVVLVRMGGNRSTVGRF